jgi:transcription elongation factor GreA
MGKMSAISYNFLEAKLAQLEEDLKGISAELIEARGHGDLSENTEYDLAKAALEANTRERAEIQRTIRSATIVHKYSTSIDIGSFITVKIIAKDGSLIEDLGLLMFDEVGDLIFDGKVNPSSPLGSAIQGGNTGTFVVRGMNGTETIYHVTLEPEASAEAFMSSYSPDRKASIEKIFKGAY